MLDCWNFKADLRPSFEQITEKLEIILSKYENAKFLELQSMLETKSQTGFSNNLGLTFTQSTSMLLNNETPTKNRLYQIAIPERKSSLAKVKK